jgi:small-conductance mechanosensitive channel
VFLVSVGLRAFFLSHLRRFAHRTKSEFDDMALLLLEKTRLVFFFLVSLYAGASSLALRPKAGHAIHLVFILVIFLQVGFWLTRAISFLGSSYVNRTISVDAGRATTMRAMLFFGHILVWVSVVLLLLDNWGVKVAPLLAGLGIGGIAIALAVQNILGDLLASLSIVLDKPFVIGDFIVVGEEAGAVEHIGLKTTRLKRISGEQLIFSNSELLKSNIRNFKRMSERRVLTRIKVLYETSQEKLEAVPGWLKEAVESVGGLRFGRAHFAAFGDFALEYELEYWVNSPDYAAFMDRQQKFSFALFRRLRAENVGLAYPTQKLYVESASDDRP